MNATFHVFDSGDFGKYVLVADGSQVFGVDDDFADALSAAATADVPALLASAGLGQRVFVGNTPLKDPPMRALSLAVAQRCNLSCTYCYAEGGHFGAPPRNMEWEVAEAAVTRLVDAAAPGERINIAFLGGEPLTNSALIHRAAALAVERAAAKGVRIGFAITTNGTLLTEAEGDFLARFGFSVTISIDGIGVVHDQLRPAKGGRGSFDRICARVGALRARHPRLRLAARVTVTPRNLKLRETLDGLLALGFDTVGFSPLLHAPSGRSEMEEMDLDRLLQEMVACGEEYERRVAAGARYGFSNLETALQEIHRGAHRPYPCGAGAGYFGVSASGELAACHRFVGDAARTMGNVSAGIDVARQRAWLAERRVEKQEPCRSCWARYLCGGGCHYEAIHRGRPACDYIRGWLDFALGAYARLSVRRPELFLLGTVRAD
jgi:uncharacterized protein